MRTVQAVLAEARATDWALWDVPAAGRSWHYQPGSVPAAFESITSVQEEAGSRTVYNRLLDVLGHDHSGTPYPAMVAGARLLAALVPLLHGWQLATVVEVLTECLLWTRGEGEFVANDGHTYNLSDETLAAIESTRPTLELLVQQDDDQPALPAVAELLTALHQS